jgi:hypothetical protein
VGQASPYVSRKGVHTSPRFRGWRRGIPERGEPDLLAPPSRFRAGSRKNPWHRDPARTVSERMEGSCPACEGGGHSPHRTVALRSSATAVRSRPPERLRRESLSRVRPSSRSSARSSEVCASGATPGEAGLGAGGRQLPVTVAKRALLAVLLHANRVVTRQNSVSPSGRTILSLGGHDR